MNTESSYLTVVILAGGNRESVIGGCLDSVAGIVDHVILIDTGPSAAAAIAVAREMLGDRCSVRAISEPFHCTDARNFALRVAQEAGFEWALMLDTDERLHADRSVVRKMLAEATAQSVRIMSAGGTYSKSKFFRLPAQGKWVGRVHEAYVSGSAMTAPGINFSELPKTAEENAARNIWVEDQCRLAVADEPTNARWRYYHGDSLAALGRLDEAVDEFTAAARLSRWAEEVDWSVYRAAVIRQRQGRLDEAIRLCRELSLRIPELAWFCAYCEYRSGRPEVAIYWAQKAAAIATATRHVERIGFRYLHGCYEGPYDVMRWAYQALGDTAEAAAALAMVGEMAALRARVGE